MTQAAKNNKNSNKKQKEAFTEELFWQQGVFSSFKGVDNISIEYAIFCHSITCSTASDQYIQKTIQPAVIKSKTKTKTIVIVQGRNESYLKYKELAHDLYMQGYNIFMFDHRGQGLSGRLLKSNVNKGHVVKFQHYIDDLQCFIDEVVTKYSQELPYVLAHSMGGAVATRFMQQFPNAIQAAVIASPMLGFDSRQIPQTIAEGFVNWADKLNKLVTNEPWYFFGQKNYHHTDFNQNRLTHSSKRYQGFTDLCRYNPNVQLGGVTIHWLAESLKAQKEIFYNINQITTPILLLQASQDSIVGSDAQNEFCQKLHTTHPKSCPGGKPVSIAGAYHELFFEEDEIRNRALQQTLNWFQQHA